MNARKLAELMDTQAAALVLYARQWCACPEDVVQEGFSKLVLQKVFPTDPVAWMYRVVRNRAMDVGKAERRRSLRESHVARPVRWFAEEAIDDLDAGAAVAALETLPLEQREVVVARLWGGMTLDQIAQVSGCSVSSAHRRYEAALASLRERLGVPCPNKIP